MKTKKEGFWKKIRKILHILEEEKSSEIEKEHGYSVSFLEKRKSTKKTFAGFIVLLDINKEGNVEILISMEDPTKKEGSSKWSKSLFKFPGGNLKEIENPSWKDLLVETREKVSTEVKGIDFNFIGREPFTYIEQDDHVALFYLAKISSGHPVPSRSLKWAYFASEEQVRKLMKNQDFLFKHSKVVTSLLNALQRIREEKTIEEYVLPLRETIKEVIK